MNSSPPPAVIADALRVIRGRRDVLAVDRLDVPSGQVVTLLGANGAGKTTLLRCLLGLQGFRAGRLEVLGQRPGRRATHLRRRIGYVPQLLPVAGRLPLTVREVVSIGRMGRAGLLRRLGRKDWQVIDRWIDRLGLGELAQRRYARISGGEQRRTLLARAMVQEPRLLLLDEPTANLDLSARERIVARIDRLGRMQDLTVLLVCHELEVIPPACRRVVVMRQGAIIQDGPAGQVLTDATVGTLYDAALRVTQQAGRWATVPGGAHA